MMVSNMTCNTTIPRQEAGSVVEYTVQATDTTKNTLAAAENYTVKYSSSITDFNSTRMTVTLGDNITSTATLSAEAGHASLTFKFISVNTTKTVQCTALGNSTFTASYQLETTRDWIVQAAFAGNSSIYECESETVIVTVEEPPFLAMYGLFIGGGIGGGLVAVGAVVYIKKYRQ